MANEVITEDTLVPFTEVEYEGHLIGIYGTSEKPIFLVKDIAEWIGNDPSQLKKILERVSPEEKGLYNVYTLGGYQTTWFTTKRGVLQILLGSRKLQARKALEVFTGLQDEIIYKQPPLQVRFEQLLSTSIATHLNTLMSLIPKMNFEDYLSVVEFKTEYRVTEYRVDFYFPGANLIVEYDEKKHNYQQALDKKRMDKITEHFAPEPISFIRVKEGAEFDGVTRIISFLISQIIKSEEK